MKYINGKEEQIHTFFHCAKCIGELPVGTSPKEFSRIEAGYTDRGIQVWCVRHNMNIVHIDLGQDHIGKQPQCAHTSHKKGS